MKSNWYKLSNKESNMNKIAQESVYTTEIPIELNIPQHYYKNNQERS
jgi:hypothetical protein